MCCRIEIEAQSKAASATIEMMKSTRIRTALRIAKRAVKKPGSCISSGVDESGSPWNSRWRQVAGSEILIRHKVKREKKELRGILFGTEAK
jgi:hypothetical protein